MECGCVHIEGDHEGRRINHTHWCDDHRAQYYKEKSHKKYLKDEDRLQKLNEEYSVQVLCECGCTVVKKYLRKHQQTNKHATRLAGKCIA